MRGAGTGSVEAPAALEAAGEQQLPNLYDYEARYTFVAVCL